MSGPSRPPTAGPLPSNSASISATPAPSSPPPSESYFSELDGTAPSILDTSGHIDWDPNVATGSGLNFVSWKKGVEEDEGLEKRGFYAISTVLNHPIKKANPLRSTRKPLPSLPPTQPLPRPPPAHHYDSYLTAVTPLYDAFLNSSSLQPANQLEGTFDMPISAPADLPPLTSVPDLFFETDFDLARPEIWSKVVEAGPSRQRQTSGRSATSIIDPPQDDLSTHLDTLERHLIHEITLRSTSFFSALSNLQDLHSESSSCLSKISNLQTGLREVGTKQAKKGLLIVDKVEQLLLLRHTEEGVTKIEELEEVIHVAKTFVESGDWEGGLGCLREVMIWWDTHLPLLQQEEASKEKPPDPIPTYDTDDDTPLDLPLSTIPALSGLPQGVKDLSTQIALQLESALHSYLLTTISAADLDTAYDSNKFSDHIKPIIEGLVRCEAGDAVEGVWREVVTLAVREGSRKHLPVSQAEDETEDSTPGQEARGANLASSLRSMDHSRYLVLTAQMFQTMLERLNLARHMGSELSTILTSCSYLPIIRLTPLIPTTPQTNVEDIKLKVDEGEIIASACELANVRASKILAVRGEQHARLGIEEFVELFKENWAFVEKTEQIAGRMIVSLRGVTAGQARTFLVAYHSFRLTKSAKLVEEEQWGQIDVSPSLQHDTNLLIEAAVSDPQECFVPLKAAPNGHGVSNGTAGTNKTLDIEEKKFFIVKATAESLSLLKDYLKVVINLEVVVTDVMGRIIEFLKSFNSRTCQVVLGAGAMRSAGLKNITAKHLALASQSLSIIVALIPYIREFIRRHLSVKQAVMLTEFDKLKRDYQEHQNEIHAKLVAIMSDRLAVHCGSLRDIDWEASSEKEGPHSYAELLVKETATLHKVLSKYLAAVTVESVMSEVLAAIVHRLSEEYSRIELKSEEAKKRMTTDAAHIVNRLSALSESGQIVSSLETLVMDKPVPKKNLIGNLLKRGKKEDTSSTHEVQVANEEMVGDEDDDGPTVTEGQIEAEDARPIEEKPPEKAEISAEGVKVESIQPTGNPADPVTNGNEIQSADTPTDPPTAAPKATMESPAIEKDSLPIAAPPLPEKAPAAETFPNAIETGFGTATTAEASASEATSPPATSIEPTRLATSEPPPPAPPKSPRPEVVSPPPALPLHTVRSTSPASPSTSNSSRPSRLSLANRLKGVMNRTQTLDNVPTSSAMQPQRSSSPVIDDLVVRRSLDLPSPTASARRLNVDDPLERLRSVSADAGSPTLRAVNLPTEETEKDLGAPAPDPGLREVTSEHGEREDLSESPAVMTSSIIQNDIVPDAEPVEHTVENGLEEESMADEIGKVRAVGEREKESPVLLD